MTILPVDHHAVDPAIARRAGDALKRGQIVALRTDTVYGLLASVNRPDALARLSEIKHRAPGKPYVLLALDWIALRSVTSHLTPVARRLGSIYWPGPMTLVLPAEASLPEEAMGVGPTVAVRIPGDLLLREILREARSVLAAPSANLPEQPPATTAEAVAELFGDAVELVLDGGRIERGLPSTIVDCSGPFAEILRRGTVIPEESELTPFWGGA